MECSTSIVDDFGDIVEPNYLMNYCRQKIDNAVFLLAGGLESSFTFNQLIVKTNAKSGNKPILEKLLIILLMLDFLNFIYYTLYG